MNREYHRWYSGRLGRDMELLVLGHGGARVLVFPTSMGRFYEWEDRGMPGALGDYLARGAIQLFCVDSIDSESWYNKRLHPGRRAQRHVQYEGYLLHEVMPFIAQRNPTRYLIATGASFGAYHALNLALRHPGLVNRIVGLSGLYDIKRMTDGYSDDTVYFNNPSDFIQHEQDPGRLNALRHVDIILATGRDDPSRDNNEWISRHLASKGIPHRLRIWDGWAHDWPWWQQMIRLYIDGSN